MMDDIAHLFMCLIYCLEEDRVLKAFFKLGLFVFLMLRLVYEIFVLIDLLINSFFFFWLRNLAKHSVEQILF